MASEVEPGFGSPQGEEIQYIEIHSSVERGPGPKCGGEKEGALSLHCSFLAPDGQLHTPQPPIPGRWLQILQGPLSIPLANSHIPEQHMFHLKPTRFALPSGAKEKTLARLHMSLERWGCRRPAGRWELSCPRISEWRQSWVQHWRHPTS